MTEKNPFKTLIVQDPQTGRERTVMVPESEYYESRAHEEEIAQKATEGAIEAMRAEGPKHVPKYSNKEMGGEIKDYQERRKKKKERTAPRRYVEGFDAKPENDR